MNLFIVGLENSKFIEVQRIFGQQKSPLKIKTNYGQHFVNAGTSDRSCTNLGFIPYKKEAKQRQVQKGSIIAAKWCISFDHKCCL